MIQEYQHIKAFLLTAMVQIFLKMFLRLKQVNNTVPLAQVIEDLNSKKELELFIKNNYKKQIKKSFETKK